LPIAGCSDQVITAAGSKVATVWRHLRYVELTEHG
jgi:hypothetical protein